MKLRSCKQAFTSNLDSKELNDEETKAICLTGDCIGSLNLGCLCSFKYNKYCMYHDIKFLNSANIPANIYKYNELCAT